MLIHGYLPVPSFNVGRNGPAPKPCQILRLWRCRRNGFLDAHTGGPPLAEPRIRARRRDPAQRQSRGFGRRGTAPAPFPPTRRAICYLLRGGFSMTTDQDLIVIGAGGAGLSAAQYGARGNLRTRDRGACVGRTGRASD